MAIILNFQIFQLKISIPKKGENFVIIVYIVFIKDIIILLNNKNVQKSAGSERVKHLDIEV